MPSTCGDSNTASAARNVSVTKWFGAVMLAALAFSSHAASNLVVLAQEKVAGDRQLSLLRAGDEAPSIVALDLGPQPGAAAVMPFDVVGESSARRPLPGFEDVLYIAQVHEFAKPPALLAVADDKGQWRMQSMTQGKTPVLRLPEASLVGHVVGKNDRLALAGVSVSGLPWLVISAQKAGALTGNLLEGAKEGEVSQLLGQLSEGYLAMVNYRDSTAEVMEWSAAGKLVRRQSVPGGAASLAVSADGLLLVTYRTGRQWFAAQWSAGWDTMWTQPLHRVAGPATRTLKLASTGRQGWLVSGGLEGVVFVRVLRRDGQQEEPMQERTGLLPPADNNWHLWFRDGRALVRGVSRRVDDLESGGSTDFVLTPQ